MFEDFFKNMSLKMQGLLAFTLGMILILGTLGKLQILQGMLNSIMILIGLILVIWGVNAAKGMDKIKSYLHKK
ncbi:hypothetical protein KBC04_04275 [Candidatus Babeliales bacterium]|nr:hypothetical protein [Candidatus Babeliales bacterium]MBP9844282.1 hypothetical protein [Candidatus Babeliales bacterium]